VNGVNIRCYQRYFGAKWLFGCGTTDIATMEV